MLGGIIRGVLEGVIKPVILRKLGDKVGAAEDQRELDKAFADAEIALEAAVNEHIQSQLEINKIEWKMKLIKLRLYCDRIYIRLATFN